MTRLRSLSVVLASFALVAPAFAQDGDDLDKPEPRKATVVSDRPNFANAPVVIAEGALGVEAGFLYTGRRTGKDDAASGQIKLRYGLFEDFEIQAVWNALAWADAPGDDSDFGIGDGFLNARALLLEGQGWVPTFGLEFGASVPLATETPELGKSRPDYTINSQFEFAPTELVFLDLNLGLTFQSQPGGDRRSVPQEFAIVALGLNLAERYSPYAELAWFATHEDQAGDILAADVGILIKVSDTLMVDAAVFFSLDSDAPDLGITVGIAALLGRWRGLFERREDSRSLSPK